MSRMPCRAVLPALALTAALIAGCGSGAGAPGGTSSSASAAPAATSPATLVTPTAQQQSSLTDLSAALAKIGDTEGESDQQIVKAGEQICTVAQSGAAQSTLAGAVGNTPAAKIIITTAEKDLCPQYLPKVL